MTCPQASFTQTCTGLPSSGHQWDNGATQEVKNYLLISHSLAGEVKKREIFFIYSAIRVVVVVYFLLLVIFLFYEMELKTTVLLRLKSSYLSTGLEIVHRDQITLYPCCCSKIQMGVLEDGSRSSKIDGR